MKLRLAVAATIAATLCTTVAVAATSKRESRDTIERDCGNGNTITYAGPVEMWPPNHKYRDLSVTATDGDGMSPVSLTTTGTHDEYLEDGTEMNGAGNTDDDFADVTPMGMDMGMGSATTEHRVRGERSGRGDGRTYTITALATFTEGMCEETFEITVPHDQGKGGGSAKGARRAKR